MPLSQLFWDLWQASNLKWAHFVHNILQISHFKHLLCSIVNKILAYVIWNDFSFHFIKKKKTSQHFRNSSCIYLIYQKRAPQLFSTLIILNVSPVSCINIIEWFLKEREIEDWSNGCWKFSFAITGSFLNCHNIWYNSCFAVFYQINAVSVNARDFFQNLLPTPNFCGMDSI